LPQQCGQRVLGVRSRSRVIKRRSAHLKRAASLRRA
jgi:hypothetical protein